jgi:30S ribosomal protein S31
LVRFFYTFAKTNKKQIMGKGDRKTRRGKLYLGTYGVRRPKKGKKHVIVTKSMDVKKEVKEPKELVKEVKVVEKVEKVERVEKIEKVEKAEKVEKKVAPKTAKAPAKEKKAPVKEKSKKGK